MQDVLKFCPNCGQPIKPTDDFCPNCGFDLRKARLEAQSTQEPASTSPAEAPKATQSATVAASTQPAQQQVHKRRRWPWIVVGAVVVLLGAAYLGGSMYYGQNRQVAELADEMTSGDADDMAEVAIANDGTPLTESDLKPLARLTKNRLYRSTLRTMIMDKQTNGMVQVVKQGSYLLLFPKYKVKLGTANATVKTNLDAAAFTMDGNQIQPENRSGSYTIASQLPGLYALKLSGTHEGSTKDFNREVIVPLKGQPEALTLDAATAAKTVTPTHDATSGSSTSESHDDDDDDDYDDNGVTKTNRQYPSDASKRNDNHSTDGVVGRWESGDTATFNFNSDGTYTATSNGTPTNGKWEVVYRDGNILNIKFTKDDGSSVVEPFALDDGDLIETNLKIKWDRD